MGKYIFFYALFDGIFAVFALFIITQVVIPLFEKKPLFSLLKRKKAKTQGQAETKQTEVEVKQTKQTNKTNKG